MSKTKTTKAATMAAALALAMAPVPATSLGYPDIVSAKADIITSLHPLSGKIAYLPIDNATSYLIILNERMRFHLKSIREEWEEKQKPIKISNQSHLVQKHLVHELDKRISIAQKFISAVKIALDNIGDDEELCQQIIAFGRAAATMRYCAEDLLSFIEQTHPPKKTIETNVIASAEEVKAMIRAEHKAIGLSAPVF